MANMLSNIFFENSINFYTFCDYKSVDVSFTKSQNLSTTSNQFDVLFVVLLLIFFFTLFYSNEIL